MPNIKINKDKCKGCLLCIEYCPKKCITLEVSMNKKGVYPAVFSSKETCTGCTFCAIMCPDGCIEVFK